MLTVPAPKSLDHDRSMPDRSRDRLRERDAGDRQRLVSGRSDHGVVSQRDSRMEHAKDSAGDRNCDTRPMPDRQPVDRQPVKTATAATSDSRAKSTSASSASGQLMTSFQPRSSSGNQPIRSDRPSADKTAERSLTRVSTLCLLNYMSFSTIAIVMMTNTCELGNSVSLL